MRFRTCLLAAAITVAASASASEWTGNQSSNWFDPLNWTAGVPTAATNSVRINTVTANPAEIDGQAAETGSSFVVGHNAIGELSIINGGTLNSVSANLGSQSTGDGSVTISGAGSGWEVAAGNFDIGGSGTGQLEILDGGLVRSMSSLVSHIGRLAASSGSVTVSGAGSRWEHEGRVWLGPTGSGQMTISEGGQVVVSGTTSTVAQAASGSGELLITGTGSKLTLTRLHVGNSGTGRMQLTDGGTLEVTGTAAPGNHRLLIGANSGSEGTVIVGAPSGEPPAAPGQMWLDHGLLFQNGIGTLVFNHNDVLEQQFAVLGPNAGSGHIQAENGTSLFVGEDFDYSGSLAIHAGAIFGAAGTLGDVTNDGRLVASPGQSATLTIDGDYAHGNSAVLEIQFAPGPVVDFIGVTGEASFAGGSIDFQVLPGNYGHVPLDGLYPILSADGGISGELDALVSGNPNAFQLVRDGSTLYVEVFDQMFMDRYQD